MNELEVLKDRVEFYQKAIDLEFKNHEESIRIYNKDIINLINKINKIEKESKTWYLR